MDTNPSDLMLEKARAVRAEQPGPLALVEQLGLNLDRLETQLDRLVETLAPVLVDEPPSPVLSGEPTPGRTMLSQRLTHLTEYAARLAYKANTLHERIEL